jgi:hypothetical protein
VGVCILFLDVFFNDKTGKIKVEFNVFFFNDKTGTALLLLNCTIQFKTIFEVDILELY